MWRVVNNSRSRSDGSGNAYCLEMVKTTDEGQVWDSENSNIWAGSDIETFLNGEFIDNLDQSIVPYLSTINYKTPKAYNNLTQYNITQDKITLPLPHEVTVTPRNEYMTMYGNIDPYWADHDNNNDRQTTSLSGSSNSLYWYGLLSSANANYVWWWSSNGVFGYDQASVSYNKIRARLYF